MIWIVLFGLWFGLGMLVGMLFGWMAHDCEEAPSPRSVPPRHVKVLR